MTTQTIQFESVSLSEIGSGAITAFLLSGATLAATLAAIEENVTLKGRYTGTVEDVAAGDYRLVVKLDGYTVSEPDESVTLLLAVGTYVSKRLAVLDSASRAAILTQQLIESYAADGAAPTVAQALMMLLQHHQQKSVSGTTVTIKKLDKSTAAGTYTLDDADDPTSITRAT